MKINTGCWVDGCRRFDPEDEDGVEIKRDREWVGLTEEDIKDIEGWVEFKEAGSNERVPLGKLVLYISHKIREKNT